MNISAPFIHRPVATTLITIAIAIAGAICFNLLPVAPLPQVDFPTISVGASLPGASAEIMASSVATPLERQFGHIAGVTEMTSSSGLGTTSVTIQFDLSRDIDGAARDVEAGINAARTYLPTNLPGNPTYRKVNPADAPIMMTTMAALLGGIPLAFGHGIGSEMRRPLGIAMVGGLMLSQVLTLYTTPVIYIFFDNLAHRFSKTPTKTQTGNEPQQAGPDPQISGAL